MARRPQYVLVEGINQLPAGSHVTLTRPRYLNRDTRALLEETMGGPFQDDYLIQERTTWNNSFEYYICYTALGFMLIPISYIKEV